MLQELEIFEHPLCRYFVPDFKYRSKSGIRPFQASDMELIMPV